MKTMKLLRTFLHRIKQRMVSLNARQKNARGSQKREEKREKEDVASYWDEHVGEHLSSFFHWEANDPVMAHQNARVSGDSTVLPLNWFWQQYGPFYDIAVVGSGTGIVEKHLCSAIEGFRGQVIGYDISPRSVEIARRNCAQFPSVKFEVADLNLMAWEHKRFDVVIAHGALHHIAALDWCLGQINAALKPGGLLYVNDYVGPQRFQWSDVQMRLANELLKTVPRQWIRRPEVARCDPEKLREQDSSEAVCSHFIEDTIRAHFHIIERNPRGGTLLAPIFGSGCLDPSILNSPEGLRCITHLAEQESKLIDAGILPSDHVVIVGKKRDHRQLYTMLFDF